MTTYSGIGLAAISFGWVTGLFSGGYPDPPAALYVGLNSENAMADVDIYFTTELTDSFYSRQICSFTMDMVAISLTNTTELRWNNVAPVTIKSIFVIDNLDSDGMLVCATDLAVPLTVFDGSDIVITAGELVIDYPYMIGTL